MRQDNVFYCFIQKIFVLASRRIFRQHNETERLADASNQREVNTKDKAVGKIIYSKSVTTQY